MDSKAVAAAFVLFLATDIIVGFFFAGVATMIASLFGFVGVYASYIGSSIVSFVIFAGFLMAAEHFGVRSEVPGAE